MEVEVHTPRRLFPRPSAAGALLGGFLVHVSLGSLFLWGNLTSYVTSWVRLHQEGVTYADTLSVFAAALAGQACVLVIGAKLQKWVGLRITSALGGLLVSLGALSASGCTTVAGLVATYGFLLGAGVGLAYTPSLVCGFRWLPERKGLVSGVVVAAFGLGTLIFDTIATAYINPQNLPPVIVQEGELYYDRRVAGRVPGLLVLLSLCHFLLTGIGSYLLREPEAGQRAIQATVRQVSGQRSGMKGLGDLRFISVPVDSPTYMGIAPAASIVPITKFESFHDDALDWSGVGGGEGGGNIDGAYHRTTVKDMLQTPLAWHLAACFVLTGTSGLFVVASYKEMAQEGLKGDAGYDDNFLSWVGSIAALAGALGGILWGLLADEIGFDWALMIMSMSEALLLWTYGPARAAGRFAYAIVTALIYATHGGNYVLYPAATAALFGESGQNYALIYTAFGISGFFVLLWFSSVDAPGQDNSIMLCWLMQLIGFTAVACLAARERISGLLEQLLGHAGVPTVFKSPTHRGGGQSLRINVGKTTVALSPPPSRAVPLPRRPSL